jgi:hypothetical protein
VADTAYVPTPRALLAILHVPWPPSRVTVQVAVPTFTVTVSPLGTAWPWPAVTVTVKSAADSSPWATFVGDTDTVVVVVSLVTRKLRTGEELDAE